MKNSRPRRCLFGGIQLAYPWPVSYRKKCTKEYNSMLYASRYRKCRMLNVTVPYLAHRSRLLSVLICRRFSASAERLRIFSCGIPISSVPICLFHRLASSQPFLPHPTRRQPSGLPAFPDHLSCAACIIKDEPYMLNAFTNSLASRLMTFDSSASLIRSEDSLCAATAAYWQRALFIESSQHHSSSGHSLLACPSSTSSHQKPASYVVSETQSL